MCVYIHTHIWKFLLFDFYQIKMHILLQINLYIFGLTLYICSSFQ